MIRKWMVTGTGLLWVALGLTSGVGKLWAAPQATQDQSKPAYTLAEYNAYQAADKEQNPQQKIKLLDDFVKTYPTSTLLPYVYRAYYTTYMNLKNFAQAIEYADRMIAGRQNRHERQARSVLHPRPGVLPGSLARQDAPNSRCARQGPG